VVNLVALIVAPIVVTYKDIQWSTGQTIMLLLAALIWAIRQSKKEAPSPTATPGD